MRHVEGMTKSGNTWETDLPESLNPGASFSTVAWEKYPPSEADIKECDRDILKALKDLPGKASSVALLDAGLMSETQ